MFSRSHTVAAIDPELQECLANERRRQETHIELIASENFTSPAVMAAQGSVLTNKYAEGYPGRRYYGGCQFVDDAERLAIARAKQLFGAEFANVQPHSGSQANQTVYHALLQPGDTVLGMSIAHGGHLSHGAAVNASGKIYNAVGYGLHPETEDIDYDSVSKLAEECKPKMIVCGASAFSRRIDFALFRQIADSAGAVLLADVAHYAGLIAAGLYPSPVGQAQIITTTTHKTLRGPRGGMIMGDAQYEKKINSALFPGLQGGPLMHAVAAKAVAFKEAMEPSFRDYQKQVIANIRAMAEEFIKAGVRVVSGGTDSHLILLDLASRKVTGKLAEESLDKARITLNKNAVPNDPLPPMVTSGVRIGSPAATTRGFGEEEFRAVAAMILRVLDSPENENNLQTVAGEVSEMCARFPIYEDSAAA